MPVREIWRYHEAQKNAVERLLREWDPPAVPCATPMTSFLKKRMGLTLPNLQPDPSHTKPIKMDKIQQCRLCASYNLQLNEFHLLMSRKKYQDGAKKAEPGEKSRQHGVCASYPMKNSWVNSDHQKTPKVHAVVLHYGGPENVHPEISPFRKTAFSQKVNPAYKVDAKKTNPPKSFYIDMPPSRLRVESFEPKKYLAQPKKKEIFKL